MQDRVPDAPPGAPLVLVAADRPRLRGEVRLGEEAAGRVGGDDADVAELGEEADELFFVFVWVGEEDEGRKT